MSEDKQDLISQIKSLQNRVKELEADNDKLMSQVSKCSCGKIEEKLDGSVRDSTNSSVESRKIETGGHNPRKKKVVERMKGFTVLLQRHLPVKVSRNVSWSPPLNDDLFFNVDGSARGNPGVAGIGGVLRDANGKILCLFSSCVGTCWYLRFQ